MRVEILGCSGGIGGDSRTMCVLVDQDTLVDAGSGAGELSLATKVVSFTFIFELIKYSNQWAKTLLIL